MISFLVILLTQDFGNVRVCQIFEFVKLKNFLGGHIPPSSPFSILIENLIATIATTDLTNSKI